METKKHKSRALGATHDLDLARQQIARVKDRFLPYEPHIFHVPIAKQEFPWPNRNEYTGTPFESHEVHKLQYFTMLSDGDHGVGRVRGDWQEEINSQSPSSIAARSNATTPNPINELKVKDPSKRISIADYNSMKKNGVKPSPRRAGIETKSAHSRTPSGISVGSPMSRVPSLDGSAELKQNGATGMARSMSSAAERAATQHHDKSAALALNTSNTKSNQAPTTDGHAAPTSNSLHTKDTFKSSQSLRPPQPREHIKHGLPPRPKSPPRRNPDSVHTINTPQSPINENKRPLESADTRPEKRQRVEQSRAPSSSQLPPKPNTPQPKIPPVKSQKSTSSHSSPRKAPLTSANRSKDVSKSDRPSHLPPMMSPLPSDVKDAPIISNVASLKKSEPGKGSPSKSPGSDSTVTKKNPRAFSPLPPKSLISTASPIRPFELPTLLSPTLPDMVEQELLRMAEKKIADKQALDTVTARHEKARRPDTSGVARKTTVIPKVGHPPRKSHADPSKAEASSKSKDAVIVKLKYKRAQKDTIRRILNLQPKRSPEFLRLEKERLVKNTSSVARNVEESEDEPIAAVIMKPASKTVPKSASKAPATKAEPRPAIKATTKTDSRPPDIASKNVESSKEKHNLSKKRSSEHTSLNAPPSPKRAKGPQNIDVSKPRTVLEPPFKSPTATSSSQKNLLSTPKKNDAIKSVAMRRVESGDSNARTPQAAITSTPASVDKARVNGDTRPHPDHARLTKEGASLDALALKLKRKMDEILKIKQGDPKTVTEREMKLGCSLGLECITTYMCSFNVREKLGKRRDPTGWTSLTPLCDQMELRVKDMPILRALSAQLGALIREELARAQTAFLQKEGPAAGKDQKFMSGFLQNSVKRDMCWSNVHRYRSEFKELNLREGDGFGPWSSVSELRAVTYEVLKEYARKEKTTWTRSEDQ